MRILILGGTAFLGKHVVDVAVEHGHEVTLFNRGLTNPGQFPGIETVRGDRDGSMEGLRGRRWDMAFDFSGHIPRVVRLSSRLLQGAVDHYTFISSISVYSDFGGQGMKEDSEMLELVDPDTEDVGQYYGALKGQCEREVHTFFGNRALIIRPGLIVGPDDPSDRFTYWVRRFARGGEIVVPGRPERPVQFIDARDLAQWVVELAEHGIAGVFHATGPARATTMEKLVAGLVKGTGSTGRVTWIPDEFLLKENVGEWQDLPLWIADKTGWPGFMTINIDRAISHGLVFRTLEDTVRDTLQWDRRRIQSDHLHAGLGVEREEILYQRWLAQAGK